MYFKQILNDECGCSSYFVASRESREAMVVDPQLDIQEYLDLAAERHYAIRLVLDTHLHADHVSGNRKLAAATGAELYLHESADVLFPFRPLRDGEELRLGQLIFRIIHTPGHRPDALSVLLINPPRSPEPSIVLSGDTLFVGDVGRPDFGGPEGARQQYESVQRLLQLPDYVEVFPAHFEGSCGKGMCGRPSSTIGFERRFNPVLQLSKTDFLKFESEVPARPLNMSAIIETNRGAADYEWAMPRGEPDVDAVSIGQAPDWVEQNKPLLLDVREPAEFDGGHLPNAVSIPQADLALRLDEVPRDRPVLAICGSGARSLRAAHFLKQMGYEKVANLEGGTGAWINAGRSVEKALGTKV
jgi:glyoxylase-like metal-dependent hydrolase (beta-lactamase superfamily II)/rhodanese-related sulfurtransferase